MAKKNPVQSSGGNILAEGSISSHRFHIGGILVTSRRIKIALAILAIDVVATIGIVVWNFI